MKNKIISFLLVISMLFSIIPYSSFAEGVDTGEKGEGQRLNYEVEAVGDTLYIKVPIDRSKIKLEKDGSKLTLKSMAMSSYSDRSANPVAGKVLSGLYATLVWQTIDWKNPVDFPFKCYLAIASPSNPRNNTKFAVSELINTAPQSEHITDESALNEFKTTKDYQDGDENLTFAALFEVKLQFNARVEAEQKPREPLTKDGKPANVFALIVTQLSMPVYTAEWYDNDETTRPDIKGLIVTPGNSKVPVDVFKNNLEYGRIAADLKHGQTYVYEKDMEGNLIGRFPIDKQFKSKGSLDPILLKRGDATMHMKAEFVSYQGAKSQITLGNRKGRIDKVSRKYYDNVKEQLVEVNSPEYFYFLIGDDNHMWRFQMREVLEVGFNTGAGFLNEAGKNADEKEKIAQVDNKDKQEIGHSEKLDNKDLEVTEYIKELYPRNASETDEAYKARVSEATQSQRVVKRPETKDLVGPDLKIGGSEIPTVFKGWSDVKQELSTDKSKLVVGNNEFYDEQGQLTEFGKKHLLVDDEDKITDAGKNFKFTEKETTLYAVYGKPETGTVKFEFKTDPTTGKTRTNLDAKLADLNNAEANKSYAVGKDYTLPALSDIEEEDGVWKFVGWDNPASSSPSTTASANFITMMLTAQVERAVAQASQTTKSIVKGENVFVANWKWEDKEKGTIEFKFTPETGLPSSLTVPTDSKEYYVGDKVTPKALTTTSVAGEKDGKKGTWSTNWKPSEITIKKGVNTVEIPWTFTEKDTAKISYKFLIQPKVVPDDYDLSKAPFKELEGTLEPKVGYVGDKVTAPNISKTYNEEIKFNEDGKEVTKKGTWSFVGWSNKTKTVDKVETKNEFTGTWTWKEAEKVTVKYVFNTNPADKNLPKELADLKPADGTEKIYETDVVAPQALNLNAEAVQKALVEKDKDGKVIGTWTAGNWSNPVKDDVNKTLTFTLTWTFTEAGKPAPQPEQPPMPDYNPWWPIWFGSTKTEVKKEEPKHLERHDAYIAGYPDGTVRPDGKITRAEVSAIFARLTENSAPANYSPKFSDVLAYDWFCDSVMKLSNKDIIKGYPDGTFKPNKSITRAEFAVIASKYIKNPKAADETFSDVPMNHWAKDAIAMVKAEGWISGYTDGTFKPDAPITRAEAVSIVNRMFDRAADGEFVREHGFEITSFGDLNTNHWAYYEMIEATHSHDYERIDKRTERWEKIVK